MRESIRQLLEQLRFRGMLKVIDRLLEEAEREGRSVAETIEQLLREEHRDRQERAMNNRIAHAKIPWDWTLETFPYRRQTSVNKAQIQGLAGLDFVQRAENIVFIGPTGTGKSGLASAGERRQAVWRRNDDKKPVVEAVARGLLREALINGYRGRFYNAQDLVDELYASLADRTTPRLLRRLAEYDLVVVDELGFMTLNNEQVNAFFKLVELRYGRKPTVYTTNLDYDEWYELFQRRSLVEAMLDRLCHHCITIRLDGPSLRTSDSASHSKKKPKKPTSSQS
jgi:DNA replication protein DnaC